MHFGQGSGRASQASSPCQSPCSDHLPPSTFTRSCPLPPARSSLFLHHLHQDDVLRGSDRSLFPQQQSYPTPQSPWAAVVEEMPFSFPTKANVSRAGPGMGRTLAEGMRGQGPPGATPPITHRLLGQKYVLSRERSHLSVPHPVLSPSADRNWPVWKYLVFSNV